MHLRNRRVDATRLGLAFLLMVAAPRAWSQVDTSAWPQVRMEVLAVDQDGVPVPGIKTDGLIARGLRKPLAVTDLEPSGDPQSVCVLIDASDSIGDGLSLVRTKVRRL